MKPSVEKRSESPVKILEGQHFQVLERTLQLEQNPSENSRVKPHLCSPLLTLPSLGAATRSRKPQQNTSKVNLVPSRHSAALLEIPVKGPVAALSNSASPSFSSSPLLFSLSLSLHCWQVLALWFRDAKAARKSLQIVKQLRVGSTKRKNTLWRFMRRRCFRKQNELNEMKIFLEYLLTMFRKLGSCGCSLKSSVSSAAPFHLNCRNTIKAFNFKNLQSISLFFCSLIIAYFLGHRLPIRESAFLAKFINFHYKNDSLPILYINLTLISSLPLSRHFSLAP